MDLIALPQRHHQVHVQPLPRKIPGWNRRLSNLRKEMLPQLWLVVSHLQLQLAWSQAVQAPHHLIHVLRPHLPRLHHRHHFPQQPHL